MFERILVALDGSKQSGKALGLALKLSKSSGAQLSVINVVEPIAWTVATTDAIILEEKMFEFQKTVLDKARKECAKAGVKAKIIAGKGRPADVIVKTAEKSKADLIVLGSKGLSQIDKLLLGSVSDRVTQQAHCAVLIVK
ncbi:universal stress protein [Candidatus Micrarchaeota archaeon]|nr:universal stress protein [Candidatus Micrarchaeota archaeon]